MQLKDNEILRVRGKLNIKEGQQIILSGHFRGVNCPLPTQP